MNCGLGNLYSLKLHLLARSLAADTRFDEVIADVGQGVARMFDQATNRKLARAENATEVFSADRNNFLTSRFPLETVSKSEVKQNETGGWVEQASGFILIIDNPNGLIQTDQNIDVGLPYQQVRFTLTGGYVIETKEPSEGTTDVPAGAAALPADIRLAWLLQCRAIWQAIDKLGTAISQQGEKYVVGTLPALELIPQVKAMIAPYVRMQMT